MSWKTENNGFVKTWAQDIRNSYKIRLKYALVPKGVKTDVRFIDTPYRFQSYQEAREYAKELFPCYSFVVDGSPDIPNFNETQVVNRTSRTELEKAKYYDVYGVKRSYMKESLDTREPTPSKNSKGSNSNVNSSNSKLDLEKEVNKKLNDIQVLRRKLDEKEEELKQTQKALKK
jgi:hypothetical protein